jgi:uncharacterized protein YbjT (DUF2867 family)
MNTQSFEKPILVLGATGKTGSRVAERLTARGLPVKLGSRNASPAFDWNDRATWADALNGVRAVYISYYPDLAVPGAKDAVEALAKLAVAMGVKRLVLLSGRGEEEAQATEEALKAIGRGTDDRAGKLVQPEFFRRRVPRLHPGGEKWLCRLAMLREPFVDADDIADIVVSALTSDWHVGQLYEVTGPRLLTFAEAVAEIAAAAGRDIRYVRITPEEFRAGIGAAGLPEDMVWLLDELFTRVLDGRNEYLTDGVERALGRPPRSFTDYVWQTAARGAWNTAQAA